MQSYRINVDSLNQGEDNRAYTPPHDSMKVAAFNGKMMDTLSARNSASSTRSSAASSNNYSTSQRSTKLSAFGEMIMKQNFGTTELQTIDPEERNRQFNGFMNGQYEELKQRVQRDDEERPVHMTSLAYDRDVRINCRAAGKKLDRETVRVKEAISDANAVINEYKDWKNGFDNLCTSKYQKVLMAQNKKRTASVKPIVKMASPQPERLALPEVQPKQKPVLTAKPSQIQKHLPRTTARSTSKVLSGFGY